MDELDLQHDYCPVSQAIELLADRWTLGVVFHALLGRSRFVEFIDAMPRIPRATLSKRLKLLVRAEILDRREDAKGGVTYHPTPAGTELFSVVNELGVWGERWIREVITDDAVDPSRLMWDIRRKLDPDRMPDDRVTVHFHFVGAAADRTHFWLVLDRVAPDLCLVDPGYGDDLVVRTRPGPMGAVWIGDRTMSDLLRAGVIELHGPTHLARNLTTWIGTSRFALVEHPDERPRPDTTGLYEPPTIDA